MQSSGPVRSSPRGLLFPGYKLLFIISKQHITEYIEVRAVRKLQRTDVSCSQEVFNFHISPSLPGELDSITTVFSDLVRDPVLFCFFPPPGHGHFVALLSTLHQKSSKAKVMEELWIGGPWEFLYLRCCQGKW